MRKVEDQIVVIIALLGRIPPNQSLIDIVDVAREVWEGLTNKLHLRNVTKDIWIRTKVNVLFVTFGLQEEEKWFEIERASIDQYDTESVLTS